ncbi:hypothetical protein ACEWY4_019583 [Coilia grayii]|uniref:Ig-like domain-containing protein n=1 Tax=Coilia grayii TaxID=363190 RepID=A0ABD1JA50_9TELE
MTHTSSFDAVLLVCSSFCPFAAVAAEYVQLADNITVLEGENVTLRCKTDMDITHKAWLYRTSILFAGTDKWTLDRRISLLNNNDSEYTIHIENVAVSDEGLYLCSLQKPEGQKPRISRVSRFYLIVEGEALI